MEAIKLQSMTDFVLEQRMRIFDEKNYEFSDFYKSITNYAKFLKQPLQLGFFVPCDLEGNVLEEVPYYADGIDKIEKYKKAREKVLFKGFEIHTLLNDETKRLTSPNGVFNVAWYNSEKGWYLSNGVSKMLVEGLIPYEIELSETAIKQIGL